MTPTFARDDRTGWDDGWSRVPHGLWTLDLPAGAKLLLGWLHSHTDKFLAHISMTQCRRAVGSSQIFAWFDALETAGYVHVTRGRNGKPAQITLVTAAWRNLLAVRDQSEIGSVTSPKSDCIEEQGEDQSSSLRSEEQSVTESFVDTREESVRSTADEAKDRARGVATAVWDGHVARHGTKPTIEFLALVAIAKRLLKSGREPDEIVDAMSTSRGWAAKTVDAEIVRRRAERDGTVSTIAVPAATVQAVTKAGEWFNERQVATPMHIQLVAAARVGTMGFGIGETVCRLAVALKHDPTVADVDVLVKTMLKSNTVERFDGPLDNYSDAARRAWTNRGWRA